MKMYKGFAHLVKTILSQNELNDPLQVDQIHELEKKCATIRYDFKEQRW